MPSIDRANVDMGAEVHGRALEVATPDCIADDFDSEVVVLNIASGIYFSLRDLAGAVWRDLASGHLPSDLVAEIGAVDAQLRSRTREFIAQIEQHGLMRPREIGGTHPEGTAESVALARSGNRRLLLETYEDMKDLILADPIHDADEQVGWPAMQPRD
jgi:Coenzyme PQQ synthesis protein D (PqqD)